jgi:hypothetical protein
MYQWETILPPFTNREDYLLTLAVNDDDTLEPVDLSGIVLAAGTNFTASAWTVTDGGIITASATQFTIPSFPVTGGGSGNNLTALAITVSTGLAINPGDPITVKDTATGLNSVTGYVTSYAPNTGAIVIQIGWAFEFEIRRSGPRNTGMGFVPWLDWGTPGDIGALLSANWGNGYLSLISNNIVQILIPASVIATVGSTSVFAPGEGDVPGTYKACMVGTDSINTRQMLLATQAFYYGGVRPNFQQTPSNSNWQAIF